MVFSGRHFPLAPLVAATAATAVVLAIPREATSADPCEAKAAASQDRRAIVTGAGDQVIVIGDSWAAGDGLDDPGVSWPRELPGRVEVHGFGGSGFSAGASRCPDVAFADRMPAGAASAGLVVLAGGLNDFDQPEADVRRGVRRALAAIDPEKALVVGPASAPSRTAEAIVVDGILRQESERLGVRYVSTLNLDLPYLPDNLHLTPEGHRQFGQAVAERMRKAPG